MSKLLQARKKLRKVLTGTKKIDIFRTVAVKKINKIRTALILKPPSSSGLGHLPFTEATGIQIPLGVLYEDRD